MSLAQQLALLDPERPMADWTPDPNGEHGEVFTRRWVVDLVLDLVGYDPALDLGANTIVEPSCGYGAFLLPIVERLVTSCRQHRTPLVDVANAIQAFDLLDHNVEIAQKAVMVKLMDMGETIETAEYLSGTWVTVGDFLLTKHEDRDVEFVVGNPPYIRLEDVPDDVSDAYRAACSTMRGRADIYVGFFEKGLGMLSPQGKLGFICADRWMRNQYGAALRELVSSGYSVDSVIVMHDVDAFEDDVSAYPAITVLRNGEQGPVQLVDAKQSFDEASGQQISSWSSGGSRAKPPVSEAFEAGELPDWFDGPALWPTGSPRQLDLIAKLENQFAPLQDESTGTRVGIGVATGCDEVYITAQAPKVEADRLMPLLMARDIAGGTPEWSGRYLVNPWEDGKLVDLDDYPGLATYYQTNRQQLRARYVAKKRPKVWYRTIDRVDPELLDRPKLMLPDLKAAAHPVLDPGGYYPHHNLYFVVSDVWDLEVLGGLLLSDIANLFVGAYCVKMRGGTYRFQAQYLRKIRIPDPGMITKKTAAQLRRAFRARDTEAATAAALDAYGLGSDALTPLPVSQIDAGAVTV